MFYSTYLSSAFALATLFVTILKSSSTPISNGNDQSLPVTQTPHSWWKSLIATTTLPSPTYKVDPTLISLEDELKMFISGFRDGDKQTSDSRDIKGATTSKTPIHIEEDNRDIDPLLEEIYKFIQQPSLEDNNVEKSQDIWWKDVAETTSKPNDHAFSKTHLTMARQSTVSPTKTYVLTNEAAERDSESEKFAASNSQQRTFSPESTKSSPEAAFMKYTTEQSGETDGYKNITAVEVTQMKGNLFSLIDTKVILIIGATAAGLLVVLMIFVLVNLARPKSPKGCGLYLNSDLNRWDPQLLRPSQKSIDTFIFGTPIPSISEMIKAQDDDDCSQFKNTT